MFRSYEQGYGSSSLFDVMHPIIIADLMSFLFLFTGSGVTQKFPQKRLQNSGLKFYVVSIFRASILSHSPITLQIIFSLHH